MSGRCSWLLRRLSLLSSGQFPRPAALPVAGGHWMARGRGGGSTAIRVEGEAESWPQPGNGLCAAFPPAVTPRVGSVHGQESVCLPPNWSADAPEEQASGNLVSSDLSLICRARLSPEQSRYTFCKMSRVGSSPKPPPLTPEGPAERGTLGGGFRCRTTAGLAVVPIPSCRDVQEEGGSKDAFLVRLSPCMLGTRAVSGIYLGYAACNPSHPWRGRAMRKLKSKGSKLPVSL